MSANDTEHGKVDLSQAEDANTVVRAKLRSPDGDFLDDLFRCLVRG
ncbi:hypothetical protein SAMN05421858_4671 [Haladaptatus litoreus]|uniref:Uncharacterized protein n=1 Tax=Haladaptatus litoreus TaxID=553468 RepID=A0A1N7EZQ4_9EURY|nr:hypothetical protein SAMN05421858_4671 [Haladaptatus litoreus]